MNNTLKSKIVSADGIQMEKIPVPRFQGSAIELPNTRWGYEATVSCGDMEPLHLGSAENFEGYETKDEAIVELKQLGTQVLGIICEQLEIPFEDAKFIDLKSLDLQNPL